MKLVLFSTGRPEQPSKDPKVYRLLHESQKLTWIESHKGDDTVRKLVQRERGTQPDHVNHLVHNLPSLQPGSQGCLEVSAQPVSSL